MSLRARRFLYISFILLFLIIAPIICLYAAGYKLGTGFNVQKTGMLTIETEPKGATIYLNGKLQRNFLKRLFTKESGYITTPAKIKNLLPGEYNIELKKEGYWGWQKKLTILPGQSTFIEDIIFFKKTLPTLLLENVPENTALSEDKKNIAFYNKTKADIYNFKNSEVKTVDFSSNTVSSQDTTVDSNLSWSPQNERLILDNVIYDTDNKIKPIILDNLIGGKIENIKWDDDDNDIIYYSSENAINYYDIASNISKNVINEKQIQDYLKRDNYIFYVAKRNDAAYLNIWDIDNEKMVGEIILENSSYNFINTDHNLLNVFDNRSNKLLLIDPFSKIKTNRGTIENIKIAKWANENTLIYANDFEIWIYDITNSKGILITRISDVIKDIVWHPSNNYIFFSTEKTANMIELDERDKYNSIELIKIDEIRSPFLNQEGNELYFYGKIGKQQGFYKLSI